MATRRISAEAFEALLPDLERVLEEALTGELRDSTLDPDPESDLWRNLPVVDSKTVARLSPVLKKAVGLSISPRWIRKGGYNSIAEAIDHVVSSMKEHCVDSKV